MRVDLQKRVAEATKELPLELRIAVLAALEVAGRTWDEQATKQFGTIARDVIAKAA